MKISELKPGMRRVDVTAKIQEMSEAREVTTRRGEQSRVATAVIIDDSACGHTEFEGDSRTFDTWMDSSVSAMFIAKSRRDSKFFKRTYPASIRAQGKDIVRTWLHYSILRCFQLTHQAPFTHAWITGMGMDEQGEAMHKSKGNVIEPEPILEKYGADPFRFWNASEATLGSDFRCSEARIAAAHKFLTKLWNLSRFISSFPQVESATLLPSDKWILSELAVLVQKCSAGYQDYNFFAPCHRNQRFRVGNLRLTLCRDGETKSVRSSFFKVTTESSVVHPTHRAEERAATARTNNAVLDGPYMAAALLAQRAYMSRSCPSRLGPKAHQTLHGESACIQPTSVESLRRKRT